MPNNMQDILPPISMGEQHVACVLPVDISASMGGAPIDELNRGLIAFGEALKEDSLAYGRADVSIISFNSTVNTEVGFRPAAEYQAPHLSASGCTALNEAIEVGLDAIEARKAEYKASSVKYYRPWLFLLTDGAPTDVEKEAAAKSCLQDYIRRKKVVYMPMAIGEHADVNKLAGYYPDEADSKPVLKADKNNFKEAFVWLSQSLAAVTNSDPSTTTEIQTPPVPENVSVLTVGI